MSAPAARKPKGYLGINHTTRGGDILAVLETVNLPEQTLGPEMALKLRATKLESWYPISDMLEMLERLDAKLGSYHLKQVGWTIFQKYHAAEAKKHLPCAKDLLYAMNDMYLQGNKGIQIGGWKVLAFDDTRALVEKTTPHHCQMEEGIVEESLRAIGVWAKVTQAQCFRKGADCCHYLIEPRKVDERWHGRATAP